MTAVNNIESMTSHIIDFIVLSDGGHIDSSTFLHMIVVALSSVCNSGMAQDPRLTSLVMVYSYL